jgi:hypothetical protein
MSQVSSPPSGTSASNTFSVLSSITPIPSRPTIPTSVPLSSTPLSSARLTGLVAPNAQITPVTTPVSVPQTVNSPTIPLPRLSPTILTIPPPKLTPTIPVTRMTPTIPRMSPTIPTIPTARMSPIIPVSRPSPMITRPSPQIPTSARSALLNLQTTGTRPSPVIIPTLTQSPLDYQTTDNIAFPSIRMTTPGSRLPLKPTAEIMNEEFQVKDYQGIIANSSLENELLNAGYAPLSKIVIRSDNGEKRTQYIKAINKKGQKVFILVDVSGYTTARSSDLTLIEAHSASIVPYSLKTGAYNCAGKDVCGVAFECGSDAVCVLARGSQDLTPKEANFVFVEQHASAAATIESEGTIMTYPVIRLSEIRANPTLVLTNTDIVTRRLRNSTYLADVQELLMAQESISKLNAAFANFNAMREDAAIRLNRTLSELELYNDMYIANPPTTDEIKDRYRKVQYNLAQRNDGITTLLTTMKKVADTYLEIDVITNKIKDITDYCEREFRNVDVDNSD